MNQSTPHVSDDEDENDDHDDHDDHDDENGRPSKLTPIPSVFL